MKKFFKTSTLTKGRRKELSPALARLGAVFVVSILIFAIVFAKALPAQATGVPFDRNAGAIFIVQNSPSQLIQIIQEPGASSLTFKNIGPTYANAYNGIGFNTTDSYLYGTDNITHNLLQIDSTGTVTDLGSAGLPTQASTYCLGSFGSKNILYVHGCGGQNDPSDPIYAIDVNASTLTATPITISQPILAGAADFAYLKGYLWSLGPTGVFRISVEPDASGELLGQVDTFLIASSPSQFIGFDNFTGSGFGAQWFYGNGNLGISENATGTISQISITNPASATPIFTLVAQFAGPPTGNNDGASNPGRSSIDLSIAKTGPATYLPDDTVSYTLTVTNHDTTYDSSGSVVTDTFSDKFSNVTASSPDAICSVASQTVQCSVGQLNSGKSISITVTAKVASGVSGPLANTATVLGNEADDTPANNTSTWTVAQPGTETAKPTASPKPTPAPTEKPGAPATAIVATGSIFAILFIGFATLFAARKLTTKKSAKSQK